MKGVKKALIISISDYDKGLDQLDFCKNDGEKMYKTLTNLGYDVPEDRNIVGRADHKTVKKAIINFFKKNDVNDTLLFYFSGHGVPDGFGGRFFANTDVDPNDPELDGVRFELLNEQMERSFAEKKIAILDCCFSGGAGPNLKGKSRKDAKKEAESLGSEGLHNVFDHSQGCCVLASSPADKKSYPLIDQSESAFTHFIVKGLNGTKESVDENGFVTPEKLSKYVFGELQKIPELSHQQPVRNLSISGELILAEHRELARKTSGENLNSHQIDDLKKEIKKQLQQEQESNSQNHQYETLQQLDAELSKIKEREVDLSGERDQLTKKEKESCVRYASDYLNWWNKTSFLYKTDYLNEKIVEFFKNEFIYGRKLIHWKVDNTPMTLEKSKITYTDLYKIFTRLGIDEKVNDPEEELPTWLKEYNSNFSKVN